MPGSPDEHGNYYFGTGAHRSAVFPSLTDCEGKANTGRERNGTYIVMIEGDFEFVGEDFMRFSDVGAALSYLSKRLGEIESQRGVRFRGKGKR